MVTLKSTGQAGQKQDGPPVWYSKVSQWGTGTKGIRLIHSWATQLIFMMFHCCKSLWQTAPDSLCPPLVYLQGLITEKWWEFQLHSLLLNHQIHPVLRSWWSYVKSNGHVMTNLKNTLARQDGPLKEKKNAFMHLNILENSPEDPCPQATTQHWNWVRDQIQAPDSLSAAWHSLFSTRTRLWTQESLAQSQAREMLSSITHLSDAETRTAFSGQFSCTEPYVNKHGKKGRDRKSVV